MCVANDDLSESYEVRHQLLKRFFRFSAAGTTTGLPSISTNTPAQTKLLGEKKKKAPTPETESAEQDFFSRYPEVDNVHLAAHDEVGVVTFRIPCKN